MEAMRTTYQKPTSFRSNTEPESVREVGTLLGGNEMEAMRAQEENFELTSPLAAASKSWSELSQSAHHSKSATLALDSWERVKGAMSEAAKEGSGGKSWGELRSDPVDGLMPHPTRLQPAKGGESKVENIQAENEYRSGKDTTTKEEEVEGKKTEEVKEKEDMVNEKKSSDKEEEKLEPERTMEGLAESSEETNSLQAFRAVEKR